MANFIDSSKILMYPSAFRAVNPESYLNTEFNLTNTKRLSSYKELNSYIINKDDYYVNFCINGYFFKIQYSDLIGLNLKPLYAYIILKNENSQDTDTYNNLRLTVVNPNETTESTFGVLDINNKFRGLAFTGSLQDIVDLEAEAELDNEFEIHHLQLLNEDGELVENKFKLSSLEIRNSFDIDKSIYDYFTTRNLDVINKLMAKDAEITNNLKVTNATQLYLLEVLENATLKKDLTLEGKLNNVKIASTKGAQVTFEHSFNAVSSVINNSDVSNTTIFANDSGITLANTALSNLLNLPFNPSGTESKVLVNTAGSSSWVTLSNTAEKSSVVYRDANGDTAVRNLDTTEINADKIYLGGVEDIDNDVSISLCLEYDTETKKHYIKPLNPQKTFIAGFSANEVELGTPAKNTFINRILVASTGRMEFSAGTLSAASDTALGAVKIGYTQNGKNYPVALSDEKMYVNVPWENYYHTRKYSTGLNIADGTGQTDLYVPYATETNYGLVKPAAVRDTAINATTGNTSDARYYGVEMDKNGKLFVNVPWSNTNTEYDAGIGLYLGTDNKLNVKTNFTTDASLRKYKTQVDTTTNSLYTQIPAATSDGYGVVKIGFTNQDEYRYYGVQLTTDKQMFVNVPWSDNQVTSVAGHYTPETNDSSTITTTASNGSSLNRGSNVVTGVTVYRDAKGHITDVAVNSGKLPSSDNSITHIYATTQSGTSNATTDTVNPYIRLFDDSTHRNSIRIVGDSTTAGSGLRVYAKNGEIYINGPTLTAGTTQGKFSYAGSTVSLYNLQTTSTPTFAGMSLNGAINMKNSSIYIKDSSNTTKATISSTGTITAVSFTSGSDIRIKENIEEFEYTKSILDLPIKKFDYIDGPKNQIGCIAQDLQKLYPELVKEDDEGYLSINESKLVYLLMKEVKQLKEELKQVKNDVLFLN